MAFVEKFIAGISSGDSTQRVRTVSIPVTAAKARLWFAAADHAARLATDVGLLLLALNDCQYSNTTPAMVQSFHVEGWDYNDAFVYPDADDEIFNKNAIKLTFQTTNGGVPALDTIYVTQREPASLTMNSDGKSYDITASPFVNIETQLIATGRSKYGTAITKLVEAIPNDV